MPISLISPGSVQFNDSTVQTSSADGRGFRGILGTQTNINENTNIKVPIDSDLSAAFGYDTGGVYNTSLYRFTPAIAGYYLITPSVRFSLPNGTNQSGWGLAIYLNGSPYLQAKEVVIFNDGGFQISCSTLMVLNTTDFVELYTGYDNADNVSPGRIEYGSFAVTSHCSATFVRQI